MTIFAGVYCTDLSNPITEAIKKSLTNNLRATLDSRGTRTTHDLPKIFVIKWDSGAFDEPAWEVFADGSLSTLVGDPLLSEAGTHMKRSAQLSNLVTSEGGLNGGLLAKTRGSFSILRYSAASATVYLSTDMIGLRPIYYTLQNGLLIFASALRVLESMSWVQRRLSAIGMGELNMFSFPLAAHTPYEGIFVLRECEVMTCSEAGLTLGAYYNWATVTSVAHTPAQSAEALFVEFQAGIRIRAASDRRTYAFLSGGMDSRSIVSVLIDKGCTVEALNFSPDASQDQEFARLPR